VIPAFAVLFAAIVLPFPGEAATCHQRLPPVAKRVGYWRYHVIRGRKCWTGTLRRHVRHPAKATIGHEPDEAAVWPRLEKETPPAADFDERFDGERR
jgi:hypothetical protein